MDSVYTQSNGDDAPDRWRLTARNMMEFCIAESRTALGYAFSAWLKCRPEGQNLDLDPFRGDLLGAGTCGELVRLDFRDFAGPPAASDFIPASTGAFCADVSKPDPADFIIDAPDSRPTPLRDFKNPLLNRVLMSDLLVCRGSRHPFYHQVEHDTDGRNLRYMRLLLPVGGLHRDVVKIYAFCRSMVRSDLTLEQLMAIPA